MTLANPNEQSLSNGVGESESASVESEQVKWALDFGRFPEKKRVWKAWILHLLVFVCVFVQKFPTSPRRRNFQTKNSAQNFLPIKSVSHTYVWIFALCVHTNMIVCVWDFLLLLYDNITSSQLLLLTTLFLLFVHRFKINISRLTETSTEQQLQKLPCCRRRCFIIIIEVVVVVLMYGWNHLFFPQKNVC